MRPDSLLRLWCYINHLLTYLINTLHFKIHFSGKPESRRADYGGLDMLNIKAMQTGSRDVSWWRLSELDTGYVQRWPGGIVWEGIWRVLTCLVRMLRIGINEDWESKGNWLTWRIVIKTTLWVKKARTQLTTDNSKQHSNEQSPGKNE